MKYFVGRTPSATVKTAQAAMTRPALKPNRGSSEPWGSSLKLVALTGWGEPDDVDRARRAGFDLYLVKPVPFERLESVLTTLDRPSEP